VEPCNGVAKLYWVSAFISVIVGIIYSIMGWPFWVAVALVIALNVMWTFYFSYLVSGRVRSPSHFFGGFMWLCFMALLMLNGVMGVLAWLGWQRIAAHMRENPEAAKLVSEHVIAPLLSGCKTSRPKEDKERTEGTIV